MIRSALLSLAIASSLVGPAMAATIIPVNMDPAGAGLNDPTPAAPVGGNPGTSVGEQRRIAYQFAADLWGAVLRSTVPVRVQASFQPLSCSANSGVLGSAGTAWVNRDFDGAPLPGTWYGGALANAIYRSDGAPGTDEIVSRFNANLGSPGCLETSGWYYGLDGITPPNRINFLDVVMHEIGHGLGFQGFYNTSSGAPFAGYPDVYSSNVYDNATSKTWISMTNAERSTAAKAGALVWTGANVTSQVPVALSPLLKLNTTGTLTASYYIGTASFGPVATTSNFSGALELVNDGVIGPPVGTGPSGTTTDGCEALTAGSLTGKIAVIDRGYCGFAVKTKNAQNAGATGVLIANNAAGGPPGMGGTDSTITIPTVSVSQADGNSIKAALPGVNASLQVAPGEYFGSDPNARARLYAPAVLAPGSSFSHYDTSLTPNAVMEPFISGDLDALYRLDLTPALYKDEGWGLLTGPLRLRNGTCTTSVPVLQTPGLVPGAHLAAAEKLCKVRSGVNPQSFSACLKDFSARLAGVGLITGAQQTEVDACADK